MGTSRRTFLKQGAFAMASASLLSKSLFASYKAKSDVVGIQLYSIRGDMSKDALGTLKQLSAMGYKNVEHANYVNRTFYKYSPTDFKKVLEDNGLKMPSGHTVMGKQAWDTAKNDFSDSWKYTVEDAATVGQQFVVSPSLDMTMTKNMDDFKKLMEIFNKSGELCKQHGMKFGYHNHAFEFTTMIDGKRIYDIILSSTDPSLVAQQLDIGNLFNGGVVAMNIIKQYPGRFELMHVKDEIKNTASNGEQYESTILGEGIVHTKEVIDQGRKEGTKYFIIEQESYGGKLPIDCVKEDLTIITKWGY
ncbi:MAG: sugar phosphate isomerase/epimerase family protein [Chitinophagales bacterium]